MCWSDRPGRAIPHVVFDAAGRPWSHTVARCPMQELLGTGPYVSRSKCSRIGNGVALMASSKSGFPNGQVGPRTKATVGLQGQP